MARAVQQTGGLLVMLLSLVGVRNMHNCMYYGGVAQFFTVGGVLFPCKLCSCIGFLQTSQNTIAREAWKFFFLMPLQASNVLSYLFYASDFIHRECKPEDNASHKTRNI